MQKTRERGKGEKMKKRGGGGGGGGGYKVRCHGRPQNCPLEVFKILQQSFAKFIAGSHSVTGIQLENSVDYTPPGTPDIDISQLCICCYNILLFSNDSFFWIATLVQRLNMVIFKNKNFFSANFSAASRRQ